MNEHQPRVLTVAAPIRSLLKLSEVWLEKKEPSRPLPWKDWGAENTRCFFQLFLPKKQIVTNTVYHNCFVTPTSVFDFNQFDIARDIARGELEGIIQEPSVIRKEGNLRPFSEEEFPDKGDHEYHRDEHLVFQEDIISTLPYREIRHGVPLPPLGWLNESVRIYTLENFTLHEDMTITHQEYNYDIHTMKLYIK